MSERNGNGRKRPGHLLPAAIDRATRAGMTERELLLDLHDRLDAMYDAIWTLTDEVDEHAAQKDERIDTMSERMDLRDRAFEGLEGRVSALEHRRDTEPSPPPTDG